MLPEIIIKPDSSSLEPQHNSGTVSKPPEYITDSSPAKQTKLSKLMLIISGHKRLTILIAVLLALSLIGTVVALTGQSDKSTVDQITTSSQGGDISTNTGSEAENSSDSGDNNAGRSNGSNGSSTDSPVNNSSPPEQHSFMEPIGYVGGSLTANAIDGYAQVGGTKFWQHSTEKYGGYGGGTVVKWADEIPNGNNSDYWGNFNSMLANNASRGQVKTIWFELLSHGNETDTDVYNAAVAAIAEIKQRVPGANVYVSGMNGYDPQGFCDGVTAAAPAQMNALADRLASEGKALAGPRISNLTTAQVKNLEDGGCHANNAGKTVLGNDLISFFK